MPDTDGWSRHEIYVMEALEDLKETNKEQNKRLRVIETSLTLQESKVKWIAMGASFVITAVVNLLIFLVRKAGG